MARLFVAIDLDQAARSAIAAEQTRLHEAIRGSPLRWTRPEQMHLTLVFLGEIDQGRVDAVCEAFAEPVPQVAFRLTFGGLGVFPPHGAPRALWIGALEGRSELESLQRNLTKRAERVGIPLDRRAFSPHLTLARWKTSRPADRRRALAASRGEGAMARVWIDHATLYHSRLSSAGSTYTPVARADLGIG